MGTASIVILALCGAALHLVILWAVIASAVKRGALRAWDEIKNDLGHERWKRERERKKSRPT